MNQHSKRIFRRHHIGDDALPLPLQSDGILVTLLTNGFLFKRTLGRVIIKNVSISGAGILVSHLITIPNAFTLVFPSVSGIKPQKASVVHTRALNPSLNFYGIKWDNMSPDILSKLKATYGDKIE